MSPAKDSCVRCGTSVPASDQLVLVQGKAAEVYCSERCLRASVQERRRTARAKRLRWLASMTLVVLAVAGGHSLLHRLRRPLPPVSRPAPVVAAPAPEEPSLFGPDWPPTDEEWLEQFNAASWVYPLPGPSRREPTPDDEIFRADTPGEPPARCRTPKRCGVDLGGDLWGEHVYAALDGVVDRVQRVSDEAHGGISVRLSHFGGLVFTHYFHLAALPRRLVRGARVSAGDVIGLVGDTGMRGAGTHVTFALSIRPSSEFPEVYWDPAPLMKAWPLHVPPKGTVAGLLKP